jgi:outer membrane protein insertion porin family
MGFVFVILSVNMYRRILFWGTLLVVATISLSAVMAEEPGSFPSAEPAGVSAGSQGESILTKSEKTITSLQVMGNVAVSSATILSKIQTRAGMPFLPQQLDEDLKRLYATGYFTDIKIDLRETAEGVVVIFNVKERPIIESIDFEGNRIFRKEKLEKKIGSKANDFLDPRQIKQDIDEIIFMYRDRGYHQIKVEDKIEIEPKTNYAKVKFLIREEFRIRIKEVSFEGNKVYTKGKLRKLVKTKPAGIFRSGVYKPEVLEEDVERIKVFYQNFGYMDVDVRSAIDHDKTGRWMFVRFKIEEGKKYLVNEIDISGNQVYKKEEILKKLKMNKSKAFSQEGLRQDIANIQSLYFDKGYISADIGVRTQVIEDTDKINISYAITENEVSYVEMIDIRGNVKTKDVVIRRELRLRPGEQFDGKKLKRSKERLGNLGFFEEINFDIEPGSASNKKNLVVSVKETKTGEFSFGAGYSSVDQLVGFVEITQRNFDLFNFPYFTGAGQNLRLRTQIGTVRQDYELGFTEPWIFGHPYSFGFDLYQKTRYRERDVGYAFDERRRGGALRLGKEITDYLRGDLVYRLDKIKISDIEANVSADLKREEGDNTISSLLFGLTQDTRDNVFDPMQGYVASGSVECAGGPLGGNKDFLRYIGGTSWYFTHFEKLVLELRLRVGIVDAFGDSTYVPIYERFFAGGGNSIRGYKERRIGPKDSNTGDPIGGESMLLGTVEYTFPIVENIKGVVFYDTGNVWAKATDFASGNLKSSVGTGVRIKTPIGPLRLDFGYGLDYDPGEKSNGRFHFSMGHRF